MKIIAFLLSAGAVLLAGCVNQAESTAQIPAVTPFDVKRYLGIWHEAARMPHWFERGMMQVTAEYFFDSAGNLRVRNRGVKAEKLKGTSINCFCRLFASMQSPVFVLFRQLPSGNCPQNSRHRLFAYLLKIHPTSINRGTLKEIEGFVRQKTPGTGELEVSFFRPFYGSYRVIALKPDYSAAVVTASTKEYAWILVRRKELAAKVIPEYRDFLTRLGFDVSKLEVFTE